MLRNTDQLVCFSQRDRHTLLKLIAILMLMSGVAFAQETTYPVPMTSKDDVAIRQLCDMARSNLSFHLEVSITASQYCLGLLGRMTKAKDEKQPQ
jgi:hypothetical protein